MPNDNTSSQLWAAILEAQRLVKPVEKEARNNREVPDVP